MIVKLVTKLKSVKLMFDIDDKKHYINFFNIHLLTYYLYIVIEFVLTFTIYDLLICVVRI